MRLNEIQKRFADTMLSPPAALDNLPADIAALFETGDIPLAERLKVYRSNIIGNVGDATMAGFPLVEKLVGRDFLTRMMRGYILAQPPREGCLNDYGAGFADFIAGYEPARGLPYLPDMARLESAVSRAYHARDDQALKPAELAAIAPETLADVKLRMRDSVHVVTSRFPLDAIRDFCLRETGDEETLDIDQGGVRLMTHRPAFEVAITKVQGDEAAMITNLQAEKSLGEALELTLKDHPGFDMQGFLQRHLSLLTLRSLA